MKERTRPIKNAITHGIIRSNERLIEYQPGNGTRYLLLFLDCYWPEQDKKIFGFPENAVLVVWMGHGQMWVQRNDALLHPNYVKEKLKCSEPDAYVLAEVIGHMTQRPTLSAYDDSMPAEVSES
jgi:hypothetical protein